MELTRAELRQLWKHVSEGDGGYCPVCDRWGRVYPIRLTGSLVRSLGWLHKECLITGEKWINIPTAAPRTVMRSYSITSLKYWGFVEQRPPEVKPIPTTPVPRVRGEKKKAEPKTRTSGYWTITPHGILFVTNQIAVPSKVFVYADQVRDFGKETTYAKEVMDKKFDYDAMMNDIYAFQKADQ